MRPSHLSSTALAVYASSLVAQAAPLPAIESAISALKARRSEVYQPPAGDGTPTPGGTTPSPTPASGGGAAGSAPTAITIWNRPDKPKFDGTVYQFLDMGDATSYYVGGESGGPITIAAQATKTFDAYTGGKTTRVVGDVVIADTQAGIVAEAIGVVAPGGARGELFNVIACNVDQGETAADCILVDYDGTSTKTTYSATIKGSVTAVPLGPANAVPENLSMWATNALSISKVTVGGDGSGGSTAAASGSTPGAYVDGQTPDAAHSTPTSTPGTGGSAASPSGASPSPASPSGASPSPASPGSPGASPSTPSGGVSFSNGNLVPRATAAGRAAQKKRM